MGDPLPHPQTVLDAEALAEQKLEKVRAELRAGFAEILTALVNGTHPASALRSAATVFVDLANRDPGEHGRVFDDRLCRGLAVELDQIADTIEEDK